jgi:hypothetical protein
MLRDAHARDGKRAGRVSVVLPPQSDSHALRDERRDRLLAPAGVPRSPSLRIASRALQSAGHCRFASAPSGCRVSLSCRSDTPALGVAGRQPTVRSAAVTAVVTCRANSSSVAWASLAPSSRSEQATSYASYRPRRTPSRLTCSQAHPTEVVPPLCRGSASAWPRSTPGPSTPTCWRPLGATARYER